MTQSIIIGEIGSMNKRVLVIDDDAQIRQMLHDYLTEKGYEVTLVADGKSGEERATQDPHDVILLDWMLPGMLGMDVLRAIRSDEGVADTPVIVMTNVAGERVFEQATEAGASACVRKDEALPQEFLEMIESLIG